GDLDPAGIAPGSPKIDEDDFALVVGEGNVLAFEILHGDERGGFTVRGCGRGRRAGAGVLQFGLFVGVKDEADERGDNNENQYGFLHFFPAFPKIQYSRARGASKRSATRQGVFQSFDERIQKIELAGEPGEAVDEDERANEE